MFIEQFDHKRYVAASTICMVLEIVIQLFKIFENLTKQLINKYNRITIITICMFIELLLTNNYYNVKNN